VADIRPGTLRLHDRHSSYDVSMTRRVFRLYQRHKLININVNVAAAGLLAILVAKYPVLVMDGVINQHVGREHALLKSVAAAVFDGVADVLIYYALHWVANHWRPLKARNDADHPDDHRHFFRNATLVQFERLALSPIYYGVSIGLMWALQKFAGFETGWAFVAAFVSGIITTRVLHSIYMVRTGRVDVPKLGYLIEELTRIDINRDRAVGLPDSEKPNGKPASPPEQEPITSRRE